MKLRVREEHLHLTHAFTISRSSKSVAPVVIFELEHEGIVGIGEASPSERYGESVSTVRTFANGVQLDRFSDPFALEEILAGVDAIAPGNTSAKAAVDLALHDWIGKKLNAPLWRMWGLSKDRTPTTSITIGIDTPGIIEQKIREAEEFPILKVKVGVPNDREIVKTVRSFSDKVIRVDANEGWKSKEEALDKILWLEEQGVEFVEQPMPAGDLSGTAWLHERVHVPLIADENVLRSKDIPRLAGIFDGINIKLMKCGGLREALRMINTAKAFGMKVMLGCMIESSVGISGAAQLSPLLDYADLDGNLLITDDPYCGVTVSGGKLRLNDQPGIGVTRRVEH